MTPSQFTAWAEAVFGKYTPAMRAEVERYLSGKRPSWVQALREVALVEHPSVYRVPPGVSEIHAMRLRVHPLSHEIEAKVLDSARKATASAMARSEAPAPVEAKAAQAVTPEKHDAASAEQPVDNRSPPGVDNRVDNLPDEFPEPAEVAEVDIF